MLKTNSSEAKVRPVQHKKPMELDYGGKQTFKASSHQAANCFK